LEVLLRHEIEVAILSAHGGKCRGRLTTGHDSAVVLRVGQHRFLADPQRRLALARQIVIEKLISQRDAARHFQRHGCAEAGPARQRIEQFLSSAQGAGSLETLRGLEGAGSVAWFGVLARVLRDPWTFPSRQKRPPPDPVNALLSLGYTWLHQHVVSRLQARGFEVALGALHDYRAGRASLACDVMEPFRIPAVDRWVITVCNEGHLHPDRFRRDPERGGVRVPEDQFSNLLGSWEQDWSGRCLDRMLEANIGAVAKEFTRDECSPNPKSNY
jgi:CRISPR-associated protein Cas1